MLKYKDLENSQKTFFKSIDGDGYWIDFPMCQFQISNLNGKLAFYLFDEVDGSTELICDEIDDLEHLKFLYEQLTDNNLKFE